MMRRTRVKEILQREAPGGEVLVQGWVKTRRSSGAVSFIQMSDGSTLRDLQVVVEQSLPDYPLAGTLNTGCSISVVGEVVESQGKGQRYEVKAKQIELLGSADPETYGYVSWGGRKSMGIYGSLAMRSYYGPMRIAGAQVRRVLMNNAARIWGVQLLKRA